KTDLVLPCHKAVLDGASAESALTTPRRPPRDVRLVPDLVTAATHGEVAETVGEKPRRAKHALERLQLLRHAASSSHKAGPGSQAYGTVKRVCAHAKDDRFPKSSRGIQRFEFSRSVLAQYHHCRDERCAVCMPVRLAIARSDEISPLGACAEAAYLPPRHPCVSPPALPQHWGPPPPPPLDDVLNLYDMSATPAPIAGLTYAMPRGLPPRGSLYRWPQWYAPRQASEVALGGATPGGPQAPNHREVLPPALVLSPSVAAPEPIKAAVARENSARDDDDDDAPPKDPPKSPVNDDDALCAAALISLAPNHQTFSKSEDLNFEAQDTAAEDSLCQFPFLVKLRQIVADPKNRSIIAWNEKPRELEILDKVRLETEIMPRYFTTHGPRARFASFSRQLNNYGFENTLRGRKGRPVYKNVDASIATIDDFRRVRKVCGKKARRAVAMTSLNPPPSKTTAKTDGLESTEIAGLVLALSATPSRSTSDSPTSIITETSDVDSNDATTTTRSLPMDGTSLLEAPRDAKRPRLEHHH
ncbi:hypothetical protein CTAYLR_004450, partial [Chrysophaeum taylorii]